MSFLENIQKHLYSIEWTPRLTLTAVTYALFSTELFTYAKSDKSNDETRADKDAFTGLSLKKKIFTLCFTGFFYSFYLRYTYPKMKKQDLKLFEKIGYGLVLFGIPFRIYSKYILGKHFTYVVSIQKDHTLIDYGPYKIVRHPGYTGSILSYFGNAIWLQNPIWYVTSFFASKALLKRIENEEEMLQNKFGDKYIEYKKNVKYKLIPFIY
mmetsp:Transcript_51605/g.63133  ORF Transcript_51605/g.63133 Transcript_51605/m.63133 type:complete len:210 (+) Transcript_51605:41-670(+)